MQNIIKYRFIIYKKHFSILKFANDPVVNVRIALANLLYEIFVKNCTFQNVKEFKKTYFILKNDPCKDIQRITSKIKMPEKIKFRKTLFSGAKNIFKTIETIKIDVKL